MPRWLSWAMGCSRSKDAAADYAPSDAVSARLTNSSQPATEQTRRRAPVKPPLDTGRVPPQAPGPDKAPAAPAPPPGARRTSQTPTSQTPTSRDRGPDAAAGPARPARRTSKTGADGKARGESLGIFGMR